MLKAALSQAYRDLQRCILSTQWDKSLSISVKEDEKMVCLEIIMNCKARSDQMGRERRFIRCWLSHISLLRCQSFSLCNAHTDSCKLWISKGQSRHFFPLKERCLCWMTLINHSRSPPPDTYCITFRRQMQESLFSSIKRRGQGSPVRELAVQIQTHDWFQWASVEFFFIINYMSFKKLFLHMDKQHLKWTVCLMSRQQYIVETLLQSVLFVQFPYK